MAPAPAESPGPALPQALHAPAPTGKDAGRLKLFGQFAGSWQLHWSGPGHDGKPAQLPGELHVGWVLGGRAVQDVWIVPSRGDPAEGQAPGFHGTTIRFYDPAIDAWRSTWLDPPNGKIRRFIGRPAGPDIVLLSDDEEPALRWTFTGITRDSFRWNGEISHQHSCAFEYQQHMLARRTA